MPQSGPPRKRLPRAERREAILEAAGLMFGERGYEATRLDDLAGALGVTKPVLYQHFDSKKALYLALLARHRDDLPTFTAGMPAEGSLEERLRAVIEGWLDYVEAHAYAWQMLFRDSGGDAEIRAFRAGVHDTARAVLVELLGALARPPMDKAQRSAVAELLSMGMAAVVLWWTEGAPLPRDAVVDAITRVWTGVLGEL
ncbi:MAG TPA: TetR/AcrR family transcriptional regulator [Solirubrobacterales bacterium]|nr:TetR/AcrR family transcriptional regulator [Solirubrobacterales bacterium]